MRKKKPAEPKSFKKGQRWLFDGEDDGGVIEIIEDLPFGMEDIQVKLLQRKFGFDGKRRGSKVYVCNCSYCACYFSYLFGQDNKS